MLQAKAARIETIVLDNHSMATRSDRHLHTLTTMTTNLATTQAEEFANAARRHEVIIQLLSGIQTCLMINVVVCSFPKRDRLHHMPASIDGKIREWPWFCIPRSRCRIQTLMDLISPSARHVYHTSSNVCMHPVAILFIVIAERALHRQFVILQSSAAFRTMAIPVSFGL